MLSSAREYKSIEIKELKRIFFFFSCWLKFIQKGGEDESWAGAYLNLTNHFRIWHLFSAAARVSSSPRTTFASQCKLWNWWKKIKTTTTSTTNESLSRMDAINSNSNSTRGTSQCAERRSRKQHLELPSPGPTRVHIIQFRRAIKRRRRRRRSHRLIPASNPLLDSIIAFGMSRWVKGFHHVTAKKRVLSMRNCAPMDWAKTQTREDENKEESTDALMAAAAARLCNTHQCINV